MKFPAAQFQKHVANTKAKAAKSKTPKTLESMEIHKAANGGYIAKHRFSQPESMRYQEPEEHVLANSKQLSAHVKQHMGDSSGKNC